MELSDLFEPASFPPPQFEVNHYQHPVDWTFEENKLFENALAEFGLNSQAFFNHVASRVSSKSMDQIRRHYECLLQDVGMIEAGLFPKPKYLTPHPDHGENDNKGGREEIMIKSEKLESSSKQMARTACNGNQKKRGVPWTEEEHQYNDSPKT